LIVNLEVELKFTDMHSVIKICFSAIILLSCSSPKERNVTGKNDTIPVSKKEDHKTPGTKDFITVSGDSAELPSFSIQVDLSPKAEKLLKEKKESIIVAAYFSGIPKDSTKYLEDGEYAFGTHECELTDSRTAIFRGVKISKESFESLADKDFQVLINIYSGRRSMKNNVLDCDILQKKISQVKDQTFIIRGKLIAE